LDFSQNKMGLVISQKWGEITLRSKVISHQIPIV